MAAIWWTDKCGCRRRASANAASACARSRSSVSARACFNSSFARRMRSSYSAASARLARMNSSKTGSARICSSLICPGICQMLRSNSTGPQNEGGSTKNRTEIGRADPPGRHHDPAGRRKRAKSPHNDANGGAAAGIRRLKRGGHPVFGRPNRPRSPTHWRALAPVWRALMSGIGRGHVNPRRE
jgi:hypothetical protein